MFKSSLRKKVLSAIELKIVEAQKVLDAKFTELTNKRKHDIAVIDSQYDTDMIVAEEEVISGLLNKII